MSISAVNQAEAVMLHVLASIAEGSMTAEDAASAALEGIKEADAIKRDGEPLHGIETSDREHGDRMGQPPGVLYTLTITDEGDANEWRSDRVRSPDQVAWLHSIVMDAASALAGSASPSGQMN